MLKRYLIANWKMQINESESVELARKIVAALPPEAASSDSVQVVLCPSHLALRAVSDVVHGTGVALGAQDVFWEDKGAYTGEISPATLKELGCTYCIVGHSERRKWLNESDEMVRRKAEALLRHGINPVICVGETKEERDQGKRDSVVISQVRAALGDGEVRPPADSRIVIAYEPVWVIGSGQAVEPQDAAAAHQLIRETLDEIYPPEISEGACFIVYGGSVDSGNFAGFLELPVIQGSLVGGASLKADGFAALARTALK